MNRARIVRRIEVRDAYSRDTESDVAQREVVGIGVGAGFPVAAGSDGTESRRRDEKCRHEATSKGEQRGGAMGSATSGGIGTNTAEKHNVPTRRSHVGLPGMDGREIPAHPA